MSHTVTALTPSLGAIGDSVTIGGTGFGAVQGASTVSFGAVAVASYTSWSDTSLVVVVPAATVSARVTVTVGGVAQSDNKRTWFEIADTAKRSVEDLVAQDETADTSPEDATYADARQYNDLLHLVNNLFARVNEFRLTLTSGTAVTTADVTGATTIYLTPYIGNRIALYNGREWEVLTSAEVSLALGTLTSGLNYDVFAYSNAGTLTLELLAWTNDTTRATAIVQQDGVWCKTGALTRRLVGTIRTTSTTQTEDSLAKRNVSNANNAVPKSMLIQETTDSWSAGGATWRSANSSTANRLQFVVSLNERPVTADVVGIVASTVNDAEVAVGVDLDGTTANDAQLTAGIELPTANILSAVSAHYRGYPGVGFHFLQWVEYNEVQGTVTWYGDAIDIKWQSGIMGEVWV